jgi:hypothetical protein
VQVGAFRLQGPPQAFDEDVAEAAALPVNRDPGAGPPKPIGPGDGRELRSLVSINDPGRAEPVQGLVQRSDTEVRLKHVRDAPRQHFAGEPVHDRDEIQKATPLSVPGRDSPDAPFESCPA